MFVRAELWALPLLLSAVLTACTAAAPPTTQEPPATTATPSPAPTSPSASVDPQVAQAVEAYRQFFTLGLEATRNPGRLGAEVEPGAADFRNYSFDPMRGTYTAFVMRLASQRVAYRGTPPTPRITVTAVDLHASPNPVVELSNCPTPAPTWKLYAVATGQDVPVTAPSVPPPYRLAVKVVRYQGRWGVSTVTADNTATCAG